MTTSSATDSQEAAFGRAVAIWRSRFDLSQKQFAERLTSKGMKVDASAVSRIESGSRSVRLTEAMLIADALGVELDALVAFAQSPAQRLNRMRRLADSAMHELSFPLQLWLDRLNSVREYLIENPELVANLPDAQGNFRPDEPDEYFDWVRVRVSKFLPSNLGEVTLAERIEEGTLVLVETEDALEDLVSIAAEYARAQLMVYDFAAEEKADQEEESGQPEPKS